MSVLLTTKKIIKDTERMLNELPELEINIGISLDALYEKHDQISKQIGADNFAPSEMVNTLNSLPG